MSNKTAYPIDPHLTRITLAYTNDEFIADRILPRVPVNAKVFEYWAYDWKRQISSVTDIVGRTSRPNEVEDNFTKASGTVTDHALEEKIPQDDIDQVPADSGLDLLGLAVETTTALIALNREIRVKDLVFNTATYPVANVTTLSGTSQWSDAASTPIQDIKNAADSMLMRPNTLLLGYNVYTNLQFNSQINKAAGRDTGIGVVDTAFLSQLFEVPNVVVGMAHYNSANYGQTANPARIWADHAVLLRIDPMNRSTMQKVQTFGWTAQYKTRYSTRWPDKDIGANGGIRTRTVEQVGEYIANNELGFMFENAV